MTSNLCTSGVSVHNQDVVAPNLRLQAIYQIRRSCRKECIHINFIRNWNLQDTWQSRAAVTSIMDPKERIMQQWAQRVTELEQVGHNAHFPGLISFNSSSAHGFSNCVGNISHLRKGRKAPRTGRSAGQNQSAAVQMRGK